MKSTATLHDHLEPLISMSVPIEANRLNRSIDEGQKIRWGVWGPGTITHKFAKGMSVVEDGCFAAVASRTLANAQKWADQYDVPTVYGSLAELAQDDTIDIVYVASPMSAHFADCKMLLEHGRSVLCEKSVTLNLAELLQLIQIAKDHQCFFMEAMWSAFTPSYREAYKRMQEGAIGDVKFLRASYNSGAEEDPQSRLFSPELGGGVLLDIGIYPIAAALTYLGGDVTRLQSAAYIGPTGVDYDNDILLTFGPRHAYVASSSNQPEPLVFNLVGDKARIALKHPFYATEHLEILSSSGQVLESIHLPFDANGYEYEIREAQLRLRQGQLWSPHWSWQHSVTATAIMDSCRRQWGMSFPDELPTDLGNYMEIPTV